MTASQDTDRTLTCLPPDAARALQDPATVATEHLLQGQYAEAIAASQKLQAVLYDIDVATLAPAAADAEVSVIVVAHRPDPAHRRLLQTLAHWRPGIAQILLVENAATAVFPTDARPAGAHVLRLGWNAGIGIARNLALRCAHGRCVVFLDDDGHVDPESLEALITTLTRHDAAGVRGRVRPITPGTPTGRHYDLGDHVHPHMIDIEGLSAWKRDLLTQVRGFDPILYGHEGAELTARLYPIVGASAFLYCPEAVLHHDYAATPADVRAKAGRYAKITAYCKAKHPAFQARLDSIRELARSPFGATNLAVRRDLTARAETIQTPPVSILTTTCTGSAVLPAFVDSLARQTDQNFTLVCIDDGSDGGMSDVLYRSLPDHITVRTETIPHLGHAAALRRAIELAPDDLCMIADIGDLMIPQRVAWTRAAFELAPEAALIGFCAFSDDQAAHTDGPTPVLPEDLLLRHKAGWSVPESALAFRKSAVDLAFGTDGLLQSLDEDGVTAVLMPLAVLFRDTGRLLAGAEDPKAYWESYRGTAAQMAELWETHGPHSAPMIQQLAAELTASQIAFLQRQRAAEKAHGEAKAHQLRADLRAVQAEIDALHRSTSWKLTAPLRALRKLLP